MKALTMTVLALVMVGCQAGLSRRESPSDFGSFVTTLYDQQNPQAPGDDGRGALRLPARGVAAQIGEVAPPESVMSILRTEWALFSDVRGMPGSFTDQRWHNETAEATRQRAQQQVERMRRVATDLGGDYLYVYGGTIDHDTNSN